MKELLKHRKKERKKEILFWTGRRGIKRRAVPRLDLYKKNPPLFYNSRHFSFRKERKNPPLFIKPHPQNKSNPPLRAFLKSKLQIQPPPPHCAPGVWAGKLLNK